MKKLKIAQLAPLWFSIPPKNYGGTERIVSLVTEELVKRGHDVTLFASGDSKTKAKLVSVLDQGLIKKNIEWSDTWWNNFNFAVAFERAKDFDVMHCHWNLLGSTFQRFVKTPVVHTFHNIPEPDNKRWDIVNYYKDDLNAVFISESERKNCPIKLKNSWVVYNATGLDDIKFNQKGGDHLVWIGRVNKAKGTHLAIEAAERANKKLVLAGQVQKTPKSLEYFAKIIKPQLNHSIKFIGEIGQPQLSRFYGQAKALLFPLQWEEPFGLIITEANSAGTPVIAFARGSMPELIDDGKTGFLVKPGDMRGMVKAIKRIYDMSKEDYLKMRLACRQNVENKFSAKNMVDGYEKVYADILGLKK